MASDAEEVAEDYRQALEDLSSNMRFEISNLTVIARENTEHALAIAEVLQQHILKAAPNKKLPSLYVLDSIVKNVGTPYTLYFGRNLFKTFMEAYAVVDQPIRRKMEEMLKTWKDPVPGSMDTRPVFPHDLVRPIENALMKARAASMPSQASLAGRSRSALLPSRNTPTPPGMHGPAGAYPYQAYAMANGGRAGEMGAENYAFLAQQSVSLLRNVDTAGYQRDAPWQFPQQSILTPGPAPATLHPSVPGPYGPSSAAGTSVESLSYDIQSLIVAMRTEFAQKPHDASVQNRLRALLDLQVVVQRTNLPPDQLELIKTRVTELAAVTMRPSSTPGFAQNPESVSQHGLVAASHSASVTTSPLPAPVTLDSLLGPGALAALMGRQSATPQNTTPNPPHGQQAIRPPPPPPSTQGQQPQPQPPTASQNPLSLLEQLRQAGMIPQGTGTPPTAGSAPLPPPSAPAPAAAPQPVLPSAIAGILSSAQAQAQAGPASSVPALDAGLDGAVLKRQYRPAALAALYEDLGPACAQCGRRFRTDAEGKEKKMAHMDWHFRVHQRSTEAEKRGTHRSWYVDEQDWLKSRETVDSDHATVAVETSAQATQLEKEPSYIPVPEPSSGVNTVCPICQEKFENKWLDTAQEWVWLDAVLVGTRAYHASCHAEATRDRDGTPGISRRTPDPVLGKRKAETSISSPKIRTMKTSA
ncbi:hypothetical protein RJ55_02292 [Drechmeria coniospora]|nr:hypothetical protein RJ55_02292 [Drechmeria coniospora]